jgi:hypothetical protein
MPLKRLKNEYLEQDGIRFLMEDEEGSTVGCRVGHEALQDHAERVHLCGTDATVFEAYRELIEQVASDAYDAEGPVDDQWPNSRHLRGARARYSQRLVPRLPSVPSTLRAFLPRAGSWVTSPTLSQCLRSAGAGQADARSRLRSTPDQSGLYEVRFSWIFVELNGGTEPRRITERKRPRRKTWGRFTTRRYTTRRRVWRAASFTW